MESADCSGCRSVAYPKSNRKYCRQKQSGKYYWRQENISLRTIQLYLNCLKREKEGKYRFEMETPGRRKAFLLLSKPCTTKGPKVEPGKGKRLFFWFARLFCAPPMGDRMEGTIILSHSINSPLLQSGHAHSIPPSPVHPSIPRPRTLNLPYASEFTYTCT